MTNPIVAFDMDNTALDFITPFFKFCAKNGMAYSKTGEKLCPSRVFGYDLVDGDIQWFVPQKDAIEAFYRAEEFRHLKPMILITALEALKVAGYSLIAHTAVWGKEARIARIFNIAEAYPNIFDRVLFAHGNQTKVEQLFWRYGNRKLFLIEDNPHEIVKHHGVEVIGVNDPEVAGGYFEETSNKCREIGATWEADIHIVINKLIRRIIK